jgi:O-antigen/teichoic acid export membrane protein
VASATEETTEPGKGSGRRRINTGGLTLRAFAARGVIVNTLFEIGISTMGLIRGFILAALLTTADYGVWGLLVVSLGVLSRIKLVGIGDKYIQQDEADQELEFQRAFTLEVLMTAVTAVILLIALPIFALVYGQWKIVAPGAAIVLLLFGGVLQTPFWVYYREMDFVRQRTMLSIEPVVGFVVAIALAVAGLGYWALAVGSLAGSFTGAAFAIKTSRYPLRWRYSKGALKVYASFSGPLLVATLSSMVLAYSANIAINAKLGLAAVGAVALCSNITSFTQRVDDLVSGTLYPAVCAVQERLDLLRESFVKSNRLALMWAMPFGCGLALFAHDLIHFGLGDKWLPAVVLLQITGVVAAIGHIGFNWDDYLRARSQTRPIGVTAIAAAVTFVLTGLPLILAYGLTGLAIGTGIQGLVALILRGYYMTQLFEGFVFVRHAMRAMIPTIPAVLVVLLMRLFESGARTLALAIAEVVIYGVVTAAMTVVFERPLIREAIGYVVQVRRGAAAADVGTPSLGAVAP